MLCLYFCVMGDQAFRQEPEDRAHDVDFAKSVCEARHGTWARARSGDLVFDLALVASLLRFLSTQELQEA